MKLAGFVLHDPFIFSCISSFNLFWKGLKFTKYQNKFIIRKYSKWKWVTISRQNRNYVHTCLESPGELQLTLFLLFPTHSVILHRQAWLLLLVQLQRLATWLPNHPYWFPWFCHASSFNPFEGTTFPSGILITTGHRCPCIISMCLLHVL